MRTVMIEELIQELQAIKGKWGNTACYVSGLAWGATALWASDFERTDSEMPSAKFLLKCGFVEENTPAGFPIYRHITREPCGDMEVRISLGPQSYDVCLYNRSPPPPNGNENDEVFESGVGLTDKKWTTVRDLRLLFKALGLDLRYKGWPSDPRPDSFSLEWWKP